jgi:hypothetical protein
MVGILHETGALYGAHQRRGNCRLVLSLVSSARDLYPYRDANFLALFTPVSPKVKSSSLIASIDTSNMRAHDGYAPRARSTDYKGCGRISSRVRAPSPGVRPFSVMAFGFQPFISRLIVRFLQSIQ